MTKLQTIKITNHQSLIKSFRKYDFLFILIIVFFIFLDFEMFSKNPYYINIDKSMFKFLIVIFQVLFIISIVKWERKKKEILEILKNGIVTQGNLIDTVEFRNNSKQFILHEFEYFVKEKRFKIVSKNRREQESEVIIVYHKRKPQMSFVYEHLRKEFKENVELINQNVS